MVLDGLKPCNRCCVFVNPNGLSQVLDKFSAVYILINLVLVITLEEVASLSLPCTYNVLRSVRCLGAAVSNKSSRGCTCRFVHRNSEKCRCQIMGGPHELIAIFCAKKSNWWRPKLGFKKTLPNALHWEAFALLSHGQVFHTNDSSLDRRGGLQELTAGTQLC